MLTKREVVRAALAHQDVGRVPYFINFTPDALEVIQPHYPGLDFSLALGNYVHWIRPPWWTWHEVPESYRRPEDPGALPQVRGPVAGSNRGGPGEPR